MDAVAGKLEQVVAVEGRTGMRDNIDRANLLAGLWIECVQLVARREPHVPAVVGDAGDVFDAWKRAVFAKDFDG